LSRDAKRILAALPPMPPAPAERGLGPLGRYLVRLAVAIRARRRAQAELQKLLVGDHRLLDQSLGELGEVAREVDAADPTLHPQFELIERAEARAMELAKEIRAAELEQREVDARTQADAQMTRARLERIVKERLALEAREAEQARAASDAHVEQQRLEAAVSAAAQHAEQAEQRALKGHAAASGGAGSSETFATERAVAAEARAAEAAARQQVEECARLLDLLEAPLRTTRAAIELNRGEERRLAEGLLEAERTRAHTVEELQRTIDRASEARSQAEREVSQHLVAAGTVLNLRRTDHPRYQPLYERIDELKRGATGREESITKLAEEAQSYDRAAVQRGLLLAGGLIALVVLGTLAWFLWGARS
jgi:chromosome segregation ATPase